MAEIRCPVCGRALEPLPDGTSPPQCPHCEARLTPPPPPPPPSAPGPPPLPPSLQAWQQAYTFRIQCGGAKPPGTRKAGLFGKGSVRLAADSAMVMGKLKQTGKAALAALGVTLLTLFFVTVIAASGTPCCGPGWLIWFVIFDLIMTRAGGYTTDPRLGSAACDERSRRAALGLPDGRWVSFRLLDKSPEAWAEFLAVLEACYGPRLDREGLAKAARGDKLVVTVFVVFLVLVLVVVITAIIVTVFHF